MISARSLALRVLVPVSLAALAACGGQAPPKAPVAAAPAPPPPPAKKFDPQERVKWYQDCWAQFNDKKWDELKACYAPTATSRESGFGKPDLTGADAIVAAAKELTDIAPDVRGDPQLILVNQGRLASLTVLHGTQTGPIKDAKGAELKPSGKHFGLLLTHNIDVEEATQTVTREFSVKDGATLATQIGLSKAPSRPVMAAPKAATVVIAANDVKEATNIGIERALVDAWNRHDTDVIAKFTAPKFVAHDATMPRDMDAKANNESSATFWRAFSDGRLTARYWAAGDYIVMDGFFEGTNDGDFTPMKITKTGRKVSLPFLEIDRFEDGKVRESWVAFDSASLAAQLAGADAAVK